MKWSCFQRLVAHADAAAICCTFCSFGPSRFTKRNKIVRWDTCPNDKKPLYTLSLIHMPEDLMKALEIVPCEPVACFDRPRIAVLTSGCFGL